MQSGPQQRRKIVTACCRSGYTRPVFRYVCNECKKDCALMKDDGYRPEKKPKEQDKYIYKPPAGMTWKERNDEALKRTNKVAEYTNQIGGVKDSTEIKFIKQRIKWNNDRIALLLG